MTKTRFDKVTLFSGIIMIVALVMRHFLNYKTSRIAFGTPITARECFGNYYVIPILVAVSFIILAFIKGRKQGLDFPVGLYAALCFPVFALSVSLRYKYLPFDTSGAQRMTFGIGFLIVLVALYSIMIKCSQDLAPYKVVIINVVAWGLLFLFIALGGLDNYSVMREYIAGKPQFFQNVQDHVKLSLAVLVVSVIVGIPLGYLCCNHRRLDKITLIGISITETIPTLALFAVMRIPLAYLADRFPAVKAMGISSFGTAPAFAALFLYALYLMVHNSRAAFNTIEESYIENAVAMGMTRWEVFYKVQIPLSLPILFSGIRITLVSTLVSATLASYIGGRGLGTYVVNGINALSIDMQLLGVIPIFVLTVAADCILRFVFALLEPGKKELAS